MAIKIEFNGNLLTGRIDGTDQFEVTIENKTDDNRIAKSFSSELTFYDDGFDLIKSVLIDNPSGFTNSINVKVFDDCCKQPVFEGIIRGDSIDWCDPICAVSANIIESDPTIDCIKSTLIYDDFNGFLQVERPAIRYCLELRPAFTQIALIWFAYIINILLTAILIPIIAVIFVIFGLIYIICSIVSAIASVIPGVDGPDCNSGFTNPINIINNLLDALDSIQNQLVACGRFHPSPYVRDYIENVCLKCGLTFQSSILNDPASLYNNMVYFSAEVEKGRKNDSTDFSMIKGNEPILTLEFFLSDYVAPLFNAKWEVVNGVLILERRDFFQNTNVWVSSDILQQDQRLIDGVICYNWIDDDRAAYGRFEYTKDGQEYIGNEAGNRFNDIIEWNSPPNPIQSGEYKFISPSAAARFRDDGIEVDVLSFFLDLSPVLNALFGGALSEWRYVLLMNQSTAFAPKFLIVEGSTPSVWKNDRVKRNYSNTLTGGPVYDSAGNYVDELERFNYPLWFKENFDNNLYTNFHYLKNPRDTNSQSFDFEFEFVFTCEEYNDFSFGKTVEIVKNGTIVNGIVQRIKVDFVKRTIKVNGIV